MRAGTALDHAKRDLRDFQDRVDGVAAAFTAYHAAKDEDDRTLVVENLVAGVGNLIEEWKHYGRVAFQTMIDAVEEAQG